MLRLFRTSQYRYSRLPSTGDNGEETLYSKTSEEGLQTQPAIVEPTPESKKQSWIILSPVLLCIFCTLVNLLVFLHSRSYPSIFNLSLYDLQSRTDLTDLRRPSQFKGLDKIERPSPQVHREIINFPFLVGRVDASNSNAVITGGRESHRVLRGVDARKIEARGSIETVIQFRMIDWGMESCTLRIRLPSRNDTRFSSDVTLGGGSSNNDIDIYRLTTDTVIDLNSFSFRTRPPKGERLGAINAFYGMEQDYHFPCMMDSLQTFSIIPRNVLTSVEWWQDKQAEVPAVYIIQKNDLLHVNS